MLHIATNTFRELVRNRFLYLIIFFGGVFIFFTLVLAQLSLGESQKIITDFGLGMIEIFGIISVLFVGSQLLFKEIEGKTIFLILSKPIPRKDFILGKYIGFSYTVLLTIFIQSVLFVGVLLVSSAQISPLVVWSLIFTIFKIQILLTIVFFFSTFMGSMLTIIVSLLVYLISHSYTLLLDMFINTKNIAMLNASKVFQVIFPPLEALNIKDIVGSSIVLGSQFFLQNIFHALLYIGMLLLLSVVIFGKKTFEN